MVVILLVFVTLLVDAINNVLVKLINLILLKLVLVINSVPVRQMKL